VKIKNLDRTRTGEHQEEGPEKGCSRTGGDAITQKMQEKNSLCQSSTEEKEGEHSHTGERTAHGITQRFVFPTEKKAEKGHIKKEKKMPGKTNATDKAKVPSGRRVRGERFIAKT